MKAVPLELRLGGLAHCGEEKLMSNVHTDFTTSVGQVQVVPVVPSENQTSLYRCLVVSGSQTRREQLSEAAADGGWDSAVFEDAEDALTEFQRSKFQLVFIDLDGFGGSPRDEYRDLCQQLAEDTGNTLLAICGHKGDALEEIWGRQLGVWLYLSGVADECDGIAELCDEARGVVDQLESVGQRKKATRV